MSKSTFSFFFKIHWYTKIFLKIIYFGLLKKQQVKTTATDTVTVYCLRRGILLSLIGVQNKDKIKSLTIIGFLNDQDVIFIKKMNHLEVLNLREVIYPWNKQKKIAKPVDYYFMNPMRSKEILKEFTMPDNIKEIPAFAFKEYARLQKINLSSCLRKIGDYAFEGTAIAQFLIPKTVVSIGTDIFKDCKLLTRVEIEDGKDLLKWKGKQFSGCSLNYLYLGRNSRSSFTLNIDNTIEQMVCGSKIKKINFRVNSLNQIICYANTPPELDTKFHLETSVFVPQKYYTNYWLSPDWEDIEVKIL